MSSKVCRAVLQEMIKQEIRKHVDFKQLLNSVEEKQS